MGFSPEQAGVIGNALSQGTNVLVITHKNPDGDAIGSALAVCEMLKSQGKNPTFFCVDPVPNSMYFLPGSEEVVHDFEEGAFDLAVMVDVAAAHLSGIRESHPQVFGGTYPLVNIDHHPSNESFGKWNLVDIEAASTTVILTHLFLSLGWKITPRIATCLLTGLYTDTGSLKHSNATAEVHRVAADLLRKGGRLKEIIKYIFKNTPVSTLRLWGRVLKRIGRTGGNVTVSWVSDHDFLETGTNNADLTGVVDYLNAVPDSVFSLLLTEVNGKVKGSLRTLRDDVDLTEIAGRLGGGGHKKASGFTVPGKLQLETQFRILSEEQTYEAELFRAIQ